MLGSDKGLSGLKLVSEAHAFSIPDTWKEDPQRFAEAERQLVEYFSGKRIAFDLPLDPKGTDFQRLVWERLQELPYAQLQSYKDIAEAIGKPKAARAVGLANNKNPLPLIIPCHRVVGSNKELKGYAYGLELKKDLIEMERVHHTFRLLADHYGSINRKAWKAEGSWWPSASAFEMMVGAILTQNTNWKNVEKALANLTAYLNPEKLLALENEELSALIRPSGYHNQKAQKLKALCLWLKGYNFDIEHLRTLSLDRLRSELLSIKGIGGETADSILVYALDKPSFVIDAYTRRIMGRVGMDVPTKYDDFRARMQLHIEPSVERYDYFHGLLVEHAKAHCNKQAKCSQCPLLGFCQQQFESPQTQLNLYDQ